MKKQASPASAPRAAALSQSASRFSAGATSTWQNIAGNSPRLAAASQHGPNTTRITGSLPPSPSTSRTAPETQRLAEQIASAATPETIRQVGWREVDRAVGMSTKRKYSVFGIGFGPKVSVFKTEKVKLPVYQETNRNKRYYAVTKDADAARIQREGLKPTSSRTSKSAVLTTLEQFNNQEQLRFFTSEAAARRFAHETHATNYAIIPFTMPDYQEFTPEFGALAGKTSGSAQILRTAQAIAPEFIERV